MGSLFPANSSSLTATEDKLYSTLKRVFGYNSFRSNQLEIIQEIMAGHDILAVLPTGSGKSLCYQLPAIVLEGTAIVISPLISLMQDQVEDLQKLGINAAFINSSLSWQESSAIMSNLNDFDLIYLAPERLAMPGFMDELKSHKISFFVIDEAHCISQWGHSFRADYRTLAKLKEAFPTLAVSAFTATATQDVAKDIVSQLKMPHPKTIIASFDRPNLTLRLYERIDLDKQLFKVLNAHKGESGVVYAGTRKQVDNLVKKLNKKGVSCIGYHAGLGDKQRADAHRAFILSEVDVVVATVAFGMGIHKPDVRFVCHVDMPKSMEQYYQEIGRAGRDGLPSECVMFFGIQDLILQKRFSDDVDDPTVRLAMKRKTEQLFTFCSSTECRRVSILRYFGESYPHDTCSSCDNCLDEVESIDGTIIAQKILSCVYRLQQRFGLTYVIDVLAGSKNQQITSRGHDQLSTYGLLSDMPKLEIRYYIFSLINMGYLKISEGEYPVLQLPEAAKQVLFHNKVVTFKKRVFKAEKTSFKTKVKKNAAATALTDEDANALSHYDEALFETLREKRAELASKQRVPAYVIFADKVLMRLAYYKPQNKDEMLDINGVGEKKFEQYGEIFLELLHNASHAK